MVAESRFWSGVVIFAVMAAYWGCSSPQNVNPSPVPKLRSPLPPLPTGTTTTTTTTATPTASGTVRPTATPTSQATTTPTPTPTSTATTTPTPTPTSTATTTPTPTRTLWPATAVIVVDAATAGFNPRNDIKLRSGGVLTFTNSNLATHIIQIIAQTVTSSTTIASDTIATSFVATEALLATGTSISFTITASPALTGTATKKIFFKSMDKDFTLYLGDIDLGASSL